MQKTKSGIEYRVQSLLYRDSNGSITAAMSPIEFAKEMARQEDIKIHGLCRIWFDNDKDLTVSASYYESFFEKKLTRHDMMDILEQCIKSNAFKIIEQPKFTTA